VITLSSASGPIAVTLHLFEEVPHTIEVFRSNRFICGGQIGGWNQPLRREELNSVAHSVSKHLRIADRNDFFLAIGAIHRQVLGKSFLPRSAEFLFYLFLDAKNCDAIVGDLEERYKLIYKKFGKGKADFWYWSQAIRSVGPIVWVWAKKLVMKPVVAAITWAAANHLLKDGSWLVMIAEVWKRIRS
jgi:hypothetical protein